MSIQALPPATVRAIGSSQVLTDPASVVKELIDNALDAKSTSISVEISANTLDLIHVRDNGHGIAEQDRELTCRRYCTSKIRQFCDVKDVGPKFLGFRGEALACAAELSGALTLTTRVEGEHVATALSFDRNGNIKESSSASHPVGTSVRLAELFMSLPVRKEMALKVSTKCLTKIRNLMQAYALARPAVRLSLKVLKAKNLKGNWTYAPSSKSTIQEAITKVVGKECSGECSFSALEEDDFQIQAFMPTPESDSTKIGNMGQFLSIDWRPVSASRGLLKQIITTFKQSLKASNSAFENMKDPFLWMNIACPAQSYDPNVEPAKDDVIFDDGDKVLGLVKKLLGQRYVSVVLPASSYPIKDMVEPVAGVASVSFAGYRNCTAPETVQSYKRQKMWRPAAYMDDEEDIPEQFRRNPDLLRRQQEERTESGLQDVNVSNPWVLAKLHASQRSERLCSAIDRQPVTPLRERSKFDMNSNVNGNSTSLPPHPPWITPARSPSLLGATGLPEEISGNEIQHRERARDPPQEEDGPPGADQMSSVDIYDGLGLRRNPKRRREDMTPHRTGSVNFAHLPVNSQAKQSLFPTSQSLPSPPASSPTPVNVEKQPRRSVGNRPFVSPLRDKKPVSANTGRSFLGAPRDRPQRHQQQDLDIRTAFRGYRQADYEDNLEDDANDASEQFSPSHLPRQPKASIIDLTERDTDLEPDPFSHPSGARNLVLPIRITAATIAANICSASIEAGRNDVHDPAWGVTREIESAPLDNQYEHYHGRDPSRTRDASTASESSSMTLYGAVGDDAAVSQSGDESLPTSLLCPPVTVAEIEAWRERVAGYVNNLVGSPTERTRRDVDTEYMDIDVAAAMEEHAARAEGV